LEKLAGEVPAEARYRRRLGDAHNDFAVLLKEQGQRAAAAKHARAALEVRSRLAEQYPADLDYRSDLGGTLHNLADLLLDRGELPEARRLLEQALAHQRAALKAQPDNPKYRQYLRNHYVNLAETLAKMGDHAGCAGAAVEGPRLFPDAWDDHHRAAWSLARCVQLADADARLSADDRRAAVRRYTERAHALLRQLAGRSADRPDVLRQIALFLANCEEARLRDPRQAIKLASRAAELAPENDDIWDTLGFAHYRAGEWKAAAAAIERGMKLRRGATAAGCFFLAMASWRMGQKEQALQAYRVGAGWMDRNDSQAEDLRRLRAEAAALLGLGPGPAKL
jgi:tetratricopeptide (TPR) repeat protein